MKSSVLQTMVTMRAEGEEFTCSPLLSRWNQKHSSLLGSVPSCCSTAIHDSMQLLAFSILANTVLGTRVLGTWVMDYIMCALNYTVTVMILIVLLNLPKDTAVYILYIVYINEHVLMIAIEPSNKEGPCVVD